jgi:hypothetical protein
MVVFTYVVVTLRPYGVSRVCDNSSSRQITWLLFISVTVT